MSGVTYLAPHVGILAACVMLAVARASFYRSLVPRVATPRPSPPRMLSTGEREHVLAALHEPRFVDLAPSEVYATLLDEGRYLCSERTMYRILAANSEVRERRDLLRHANHPRPELLATKPNELWSWDITKLKGPAKWTYFYLYVVLDVFSRYVVGWMVATEESAVLAKKLIADLGSCRSSTGSGPTCSSARSPRSSLVTASACATCITRWTGCATKRGYHPRCPCP